jgi:metallophosphoesterase (TIGR00282 family)
VDLEGEETVAVLQIQGRSLMAPIDCPFRTVDHFLKQIREKTKNIIVDFHAETTSEKIAMAWHLDGKVSAIIGTHTHIQTADAQILPNGTAYITDVGMTGPYNSVIGMSKEVSLKRMLLQTPQKFELAEGDLKISGVVVEIDTLTNQAMTIQSFMYPEFQRVSFL